MRRLHLVLALSAIPTIGLLAIGWRSLVQGEATAAAPAPAVPSQSADAGGTPRGTRGVGTTAPSRSADAAVAPKAVAPDKKAPRQRSVLIRDVPHLRQKPDFCGEACAAMYLNRLGQPVDQDYVFDRSGLDPAEGRGCYTRELAAALQRIGFRIGPVWHQVPARKSAAKLQTLWSEFYADLVAGVPSIVCMYYDDRPSPAEHFRLVLGYDAESDEVIYHDPGEDRGAYLRMKLARFLALWPLKSGKESWSMIRLRLEPGELEHGKAAEGFTAADYAQHVMRLKKKVPGPEFSIVIQPPFVVIGDEPAGDVRRYAERTIKWAVDRLKAAYFEKDPAEILDVWLFRDKESYEKHCRAIFKHAPTTPYGYYSDSDRALVMNIATGGGTLVHEIVHPFMAANFPGCPAWFNEGLGSLYEQCEDKDGLIHGLTNWRLAGLQEAIRKKQVPSFQALCTTTDDRFYADGRGTNYAQARYLCYYLQEQGLLQKFYRRFAGNRAKDPSGYETLKAVLGRDDAGMKTFQREWEAYVLRLVFRG